MSIEQALGTLVGALRDGDRAAALGCFTPDGAVLVPHPSGDLRYAGEPELSAGLDRLGRAFGELEFVPNRRYLGPGLVVEEGIATGRHTGEFLGQAASGAPVCIRLRLSAEGNGDGRLRQLTVQPDLGTLRVQLGLPSSAAESAYAAIAEIRARNLDGLQVIELAEPEPPPGADAAPAVPPRRRRRRGAVLAGAGLLALAVLAGALLLARPAHHPVSTAGSASAASSPAAAAPTATATTAAPGLPAIAAVPTAKPTVQAGQQLVLGADVLFAFDSATLTPAAQAEIAALAARIRAAGVAGTIQVNGYTDNVGTADYALVLSRNRALAVAQALQPALAGLPVQLAPQGFGAADPVAPNSTPAGQARNRRVTIVLPQRP